MCNFRKQFLRRTYQLEVVLEDEIREPPLPVGARGEERPEPGDVAGEEQLGERRGAEPPQHALAGGAGHVHQRARGDDRRDQARLRLRHPERHEAAVAEADHRAPLHAETPQRRRHALRLERGGPAARRRRRATEEEKVRDVHVVVLGEGSDLEQCARSTPSIRYRSAAQHFVVKNNAA